MQPASTRRVRKATDSPSLETTSQDLSKQVYEQSILARQSESVHQTQVVDDLKWVGFDKDLIYHTHIAKRSQYGYPDLYAIRRSDDPIPSYVSYSHPRMIAAELKTQKGWPTAEQVKWLDAMADLRDNGGLTLEVYLIRPSDREAFRVSLMHGPNADGALTQWGDDDRWSRDRAKARPVSPKARASAGLAPRKRKSRGRVGKGTG